MAKFTLRVLLDGLIAYVIGPDDVTAYLVNDSHHQPFLLYSQGDPTASCTHANAVALFKDLNLKNPPSNDLKACRFTSRTPISIEPLKAGLQYQDTVQGPCPRRTNQNAFGWVARISDVADEDLNSASDIATKAIVTLEMTEGHLQTFAFDTKNHVVSRLKARPRAGGQPSSRFDQAIAETVLLAVDVPESKPSVKITVGSETITLKPADAEPFVDVVIGNLPPQAPASGNEIFADHFDRFYDLAQTPPQARRLPHWRVNFPRCPQATEIPHPASYLLLELHQPAKTESKEITVPLERPICPQARF